METCMTRRVICVMQQGRVEEEDVNYIGGAGFQGNKGGNRNSYGNRINFNQNSQYQKPYNNSYNNNMNFETKHPHPRNPDNVRIDRNANSNVDRHSEADINRQPLPPIDRRAPITYRVDMPKIDVERLNALRPKPKPSEQPPELVRTPSNDGDDPMKEDRVSTRRTLRRRKEKVTKHLKREDNEKEKENFQKRVFRIPLHKPFEEAYYSHRL
ncbi:hypothetical protein F2Q69_00035914 [Brassica cretica]|uniref:Uncharacterized protein n=1 Tax=Brassica cretica TaxID=69181 RepID=A0A8S9SEH5_BRACR|nr:hypothetical protein F2Q69_00035914 [Brassica cretica]